MLLADHQQQQVDLVAEQDRLALQEHKVKVVMVVQEDLEDQLALVV